MLRQELSIALGTLPGIDGPQQLAATLYAPTVPPDGQRVRLVVALHGAGCDQRYYDVPRPGYSFRRISWRVATTSSRSIIWAWGAVPGRRPLPA